MMRWYDAWARKWSVTRKELGCLIALMVSQVFIWAFYYMILHG